MLLFAQPSIRCITTINSTIENDRFVILIIILNPSPSVSLSFHSFLFNPFSFSTVIDRLDEPTQQRVATESPLSGTSITACLR